MTDRSRAWCFTLNNYDDTDINSINDIDCQYLIYGKEIAPTTNTPHLQGFIYFKNKITFGGLKKKLPSKCHIEKTKGSIQDNITYCSKEGDIFTKGEAPKQGDRTDLKAIKEEIKKGKTVDDITMEEPEIYHQYGRTLEKLEDITQRSKFRTEMTTCDWLTGPTGCGKSHRAFEGFSPSTHYVLNTEDKGWWDGYTGQHTVIINDFKGEIRYGNLLQLIDKWPYSVPRRHRQPAPFVSKHVIITSIMRPEEVYHGLHAKDGIDQLLRRINIINIGCPDVKCPEVPRGNTIPGADEDYGLLDDDMITDD